MTKIDLKKYILRKLGSPVINIELADEQMDDCIEEALERFIELHYDGTDEGFIFLDVIKNQQNYTLPEIVQDVLEIMLISNNILNDESLLVQPFYVGNNYSSDDLNLVDVEVFKQHMETVSDYFENDIMYDYNTTTKKLKLHTKPLHDETVALHVYSSPEDETVLYQNSWIKKYCVALSKIQWGINLGKYDGATLPGGVALNYESIKSEGKEEKEQLDLELEERYGEPIDFAVG